MCIWKCGSSDVLQVCKLSKNEVDQFITIKAMELRQWNWVTALFFNLCIYLFFQCMNVCVCARMHMYICVYVSVFMCVWVHYERGQRSMSEVSQVCFLSYVLGLSLNLGLPVSASLTSPACYDNTLSLPPKFFLTRGCLMSYAFTRMPKIWTLGLMLEYQALYPLKKIFPALIFF